jgi:hypothetical protein
MSDKRKALLEDISRELLPEIKYVQELADKWDAFASQEMICYDDNLLKTRVLDPHDGRLPFYLVSNEGREKYIKKISQKQDNLRCPFCSDLDLKISDLQSLIVLPNRYPCLPYQYILAPIEHINRLEIEYIKDAIAFSKKTGFKVYCNAYGSGGAYDHLVFQASGKHSTAPERGFFNWARANPLIKERGISVEVIDHKVFGIKIVSDSIRESSSIIYEFANIYNRPLNLVFFDNQSYIFPRTSIEIPTGFGRWKFGALEAIGIFICQDAKSFHDLSYDQLEKAMAEISPSDADIQCEIKAIISKLAEEQSGSQG